MSKHVLIVGGGIAGLASAWELARNGLQVSLLERRQAGQESSWAGAGILSALLPWDYRRPVNRLIQASLAQYPAWIDALRQVASTDPEYRQTGMLVLPPFDAQAADRWLNDRALGLDSLPAEIAERLPGATAGLWLGHVAQVRNPRILSALRQACEASGVKISEMSQVNGLKTAGDRVSGVVTDAGLWQADDYLLTTGAWSAQLLGSLSPNLPVRPMRGQMLLYQTAPGTLPCIVYREGGYLVPRADVAAEGARPVGGAAVYQDSSAGWMWQAGTGKPLAVLRGHVFDAAEAGDWDGSAVAAESRLTLLVKALLHAASLALYLLPLAGTLPVPVTSRRQVDSPPP